MSQYKLWPVFRLPNLLKLELDLREQPLNGDNRTISPHYKSRISNIEKLKIVGMQDKRDYCHDRSQSAACKALRHVFVSIEALYMIGIVIRSLSLHIHNGALTKL